MFYAKEVKVDRNTRAFFLLKTAKAQAKAISIDLYFSLLAGGMFAV
jgi:hypothetical protein